MTKANHTVGLKCQLLMTLYLYLSLFMALLPTFVYTGSRDEKCCPRKSVGGVLYTFSHKSPAAKYEYGCSSECVYTEDEDGGETCFGPGPLETECLGPKCKKLPGLPKKYCQPGQKWCWPTFDQVKEFNESIKGNEKSCLGLKKFVRRDDPHYAHKKGNCLPYSGLLNNINATYKFSRELGGDLHVCRPKKSTKNNYQTPDPNCDANPFITHAHYENNGTDQMACMTPYQFLSNRNYKKEWMPFFIVTAETPENVSKALIFANNHSLGVAVMSTGHELQDRNAGPAPNSLLIRTTCFRDFDAYNTTNITYVNGKKWTEGYAVVGAGQTFGQNFWHKINKSEGLYPLAAAANREITGGSRHSVGIVGWMLSGGKGWVTPMYGFGVDQLLDVDIVLVDGTITNANYSYNEDLFWAIRGGGGGFGIITSLKMILHKPVCGTMTNCYSIWSTTWTGPYNSSDTVLLEDIKHVLMVMFKWTATFKVHWNSMTSLTFNPNNGNFSLSINAEYFGYKSRHPIKYNSFKTTFKDLNITNAYHEFNGKKSSEKNTPPIITDKYYCEIFPDPSNTNNCTFHPSTVQRWSQSIRMVVNSTTTLDPKFLDALISMWQPLCDNDTYTACSTGFQFHYFFTSGNKSYDTGGAISEGLREAAMQFFNTGVQTNNMDMTFEEKESWMHYNLAPAMYPFSNTSYFNAAEYTLDPGQWQRRFWGKEIYCKLLRIKKKYDPEGRLNCRHCVGSEVWSEPSE